MLRQARPALCVATACLFLATAGCSATDLSKHTYTRVTVAEGAGGAGPGNASQATDGSSAFAVDKLRLLDPCGLLDKQMLSQFGTPADSNRSMDYNECANYMKDTGGRTLSITVRVGESLPSGVVQRATQQFGGLKADVSPLRDGGSCFVSAITQEAPNAFGIITQVGYSAGDPCEPAKKVADAVVAKVRSSPPMRVDKGALAPLDTCAVLDTRTVNDVVPGATGKPYGLHQCDWTHGGSQLEVTFRLGHDPKEDTLEPVNVGGVTGYQKATETIFPQCSLSWLHRKLGDTGEIVDLRFDNISRKPDLDACAKVQGVAKALLAKLPKA